MQDGQRNKIVLGLDIGIASIGWSLVKFVEETFDDEDAEKATAERSKIVDFTIQDIGVRTFAVSQDKDRKSLQKSRGEARRVRRTLRHRRYRARCVKELLQNAGLIDCLTKKSFENFVFGNLPKHPTPYELRKKALDEKLSPLELVRVFYHIVRHRGFYFASKSEIEKETDSGKVKAGLKSLSQKMKEYKTVGAYLATLAVQRNRGSSYINCIKRDWLKEELEQIIKVQHSYGYAQLDEEFTQNIVQLLMHQRGYKAEVLFRLWGKCPVFGQDGDVRAPECSATAEYFTLLNRVNNLHFVDDAGRRLGRLNVEQRAILIEAAYTGNGELTLWQARAALGTAAKGKLFGLCKYEEHTEAVKAVKLEELAKCKYVLNVYSQETGEHRPLSAEESRHLEGACEHQRQFKSKSKDMSYARIRGAVGLSKNILFADIKYPPLRTVNETDFLKYYESKTQIVKLIGTKGFAKAFGKRWPEMQPCRVFLDDLAFALAKEKEDTPRLEAFEEVQKKHGIILLQDEINTLLELSFSGTAAYSLRALRVLLPFLEQGKMHHEAKDYAVREGLLPDVQAMDDAVRQAVLPEYEGDFLRNPVVGRVFSQTRKLINAINKKHGYCIDEIHIEVGAEIANGKLRKNEITAGQELFQAAKERAVIRLTEFGMAINSANILKMRLFMEQDETCVYTGKKIVLTQGANGLYFDDCEVDHILPFSRTFSDAQNNKVLVAAKANQEKGNHIPREWLQGAAWDVFVHRVTNQMPHLAWNKKRNLLRESLTPEDRLGFITRNLNDMRYTSRAVVDYLRKYFRFSQNRPDINILSRVQVVAGGITAMLRYAWGIAKDRNKDDKHHAVDATVVACTNRGHVFFLAKIAPKYNSQVKFVFNDIFQKDHRLASILTKKLEEMNVSRMPRHTVTGAAHEEKILSFKSEEFHKKKGRYEPINQGWAKMGTMARADIFCDTLPNAKGQRKHYVVPLYPQDFLKDTLPSMAIVDNAKGCDWLDVSDVKKYRFCFSLFKDDLVKLDGIFYYVAFVQGTQSNIELLPFSFPSGKTSGEDKSSTKKTTRRGEWQKYQIDMLGNIHRVRKEKRLGTRKEIHPKKYKP